MLVAPLLAVTGTLTGAAALSASRSNAGSGCAQTTAVRVAAPVEIAPTLRQLTAPLAQRPGTCLAVDVTARDAQTVARDIAVGSATAPQVWVTDSPLFVERVTRARRTARLDAGPSVATSPITFGVPGGFADGTSLPASARTAMSAFSPQNGKVSLAAVLAQQGGKVPLRVADPETSTATLLGATGALAVTGADGTGGAGDEAALGLARTMVGASHTWSSDAELQQLAANRDPGAAIWPASEQQLYTLNHDRPSARAAGTPFAEGNPMLDYRVVPVTTPTGAADPVATRAAEALRSSLTSPAGVNALRDAGFRVGGTGGTKATVPGLTGATVTPLPLTLPAVEEAVRVTDAVGLDISMLTVMDVTGSMAHHAAGGQTRIQMATSAVQRAVTALPASTRFGLWEFADGINGRGSRAPYKQVLPVAPLDTRSGGATQQQAALAALDAMPKHVAGSTPLYDTILAAYRSAQAAHDPSTTSAMVLVTDGRNEASTGLDLQGLLDRLAAAKDPARPVKVVLVGIGEQADMPTLRTIAQATGGAAYNASDPATISDVVFDAIAQRITAATEL